MGSFVDADGAKLSSIESIATASARLLDKKTRKALRRCAKGKTMSRKVTEALLNGCFIAYASDHGGELCLTTYGRAVLTQLESDRAARLRGAEAVE